MEVTENERSRWVGFEFSGVQSICQEQSGCLGIKYLDSKNHLKEISVKNKSCFWCLKGA